MPRLAALLTVLLLAVAAPAALAQTGDQGGAFGPLPPAAPEPTADADARPGARGGASTPTARCCSRSAAC